MIYLKNFDTHVEYEEYMNVGITLPNVSLCEQENEVHYNPYVPFFCKLTLDDGSVIELEGSGDLNPNVTGQYVGNVVSAEIGELCTSITYAFMDAYKLTSATISNSVTNMQASFANCTNLLSVNVPDSVTTIGPGTFSGCSNLISITIPNSVTSIGYEAFRNCSGLTSVTIPNSVTIIGSNAFNSCTGLTSITIPESVKTLQSSFNQCTFENVVYLADLDFSLSTFGSSTIKHLTINGKTERISQRGLRGSVGLETVVLGDSVTSIGENAFEMCTGMTSLTIGSSVTDVGNYSINNCSSLTSITSLAMTAPTIYNNTFYVIKDNGTLYVPSGSSGYDAWMNKLPSGWTIENIA